MAGWSYPGPISLGQFPYLWPWALAFPSDMPPGFPHLSTSLAGQVAPLGTDLVPQLIQLLPSTELGYYQMVLQDLGPSGHNLHHCNHPGMELP
eukprot:12402897-Karenia_brevis.AAC.1